jgi:hypothetical protein
MCEPMGIVRGGGGAMKTDIARVVLSIATDDEDLYDRLEAAILTALDEQMTGDQTYVIRSEWINQPVEVTP